MVQTSFPAGGFPAEDLFPYDLLPVLYNRARQLCPGLLQYGKPQGLDVFRDAVRPYLQELGAVVRSRENILVTSGSQGALDTLGKIFITRGKTKIAVTVPAYLGALAAFNAFEPAEYISVATDEDGVIPDSLDEAYAKGADFFYGVFTFDNPTGVTTTLARRREIAKIARKHRKPFIDDDPYNKLRYEEGVPDETTQSFAPENGIYLTSTSKIVAPGLRLGVVVAPEPVARAMTQAKPDLCTGNLVQGIAGVFIKDGYWRNHVAGLINAYRLRRDTMRRAVEQYFPAGWEWSNPKGGMFLWGVGPEGTDAEAAFLRALEQNVAFMYGSPFFANPDAPMAKRTIRLNFTFRNEADIPEGIRRLGGIFEGNQESSRRVEIFPAP